MNKVFRSSKRIFKKSIAMLVVCIILISSVSTSVFAQTITSDTTSSDVVSSAATGSFGHSGYGVAKTNGATVNYTYTGDIITASMNLYDCVSDKEIAGGQPDSIANGNTDPFKTFNRAVSDDGDTVSIVSNAADNITFKYTPQRRGVKEDDVHIYLFDGDGHNNSWPGYNLYYNQTSGLYELTIPFSEIGFTPTAMILNGTDACGAWQTDDVEGLSFGANKSFIYSDCIKTSSSGNMTVRISKNDSRVMMLNGENKVGQGLHLKEGNVILNVYDDNGHYGTYAMQSDGTDWKATFDASYLDSSFYVSFKSDQYFDGNINSYSGNAETDSYQIEKGYDYIFAGKYNVQTGSSVNITSKTKYEKPLYFGCFYRGNNAGDYNNARKPDYDNFYWSVNIGQRQNIDASVSGLVDSELHDNKLTQNNTVLPYFDSTWVSQDVSRSGLMNSYEDVQFPYYKIRVDASEIKGSDDSTTGYADFYQFNSKDVNLMFNKSTKQFTESTTVIHSQATNSSTGTPGFYPFNTTDDNTKLNLGFGARFDVPFRLSANGRVETVDAMGRGTGKYVDSMFEFVGDDDVWVFIDGKLVLDLGGCHKDATGFINFAERKSYANSSFAFGANNDTLDRSSDTVVKNLNTIFSGTDMFADGMYDETKIHTLSLFYMERGMYESDLLMRFNFAVIPNENSLRVVNVTDFGNINPAFVSAAEAFQRDYAFVYTLNNTGTDASQQSDSGILYPTHDEYSRNGHILSTGGGPVEDTGGIYLDTSYDLDGNGKTWDSDGARIGAYLWGGSSEPKTVLAEQVDEHLYRVDTEDYTSMHFMRIASGCTSSFPVTSGYLSQGSSGYWNRYQVDAFTAGATYKINGWDSGYLSTTTFRDIYPAQSYNYDPTNSAVSNTSYEWVDVQASLNTDYNDGRSGLTGKTDSNGRFILMPGELSMESSAKFLGQFAKGSRINIVQSDFIPITNMSNLAYPQTALKATDVFDTVGVSVYDYYGKLVSYTSLDDDDNKGASFVFDNNTAAGTPASSPVALTVVFNTEKTFSTLSVRKVVDSAYTGSAVCTFKLEMRHLFGVYSYDNMIDYTSMDVSGSSTCTHLNADGTFTLKAGERVHIMGVPDKTEYKFTEVSVSDPDLHFRSSSHSDGWHVLNGNMEESIENAFDTFDVQINKDVECDLDVNVDEYQRFDVTGTITSENYDLTSMHINGNNNFYASTTGNALSYYAFVSKTEPLIITGLPPDAIVSVNEIPDDDSHFSSDLSTTSASLDIHNRSATLVNVYKETALDQGYSVYINKSLAGYYDEYGVSDYTDFHVHVTITNTDTDTWSYFNNITCSRSSNEYHSPGEYSLVATLSQRDSLSIDNIPAGSRVDISEDFVSDIDDSLSVTSWSGEINSNENVTLVNYYPSSVSTHNVYVMKSLSGNYADSNVSVSTRFPVTVELTNTSHPDFLNNVTANHDITDEYSPYGTFRFNTWVSGNGRLILYSVPDDTNVNVVEDTSGFTYLNASRSTTSRSILVSDGDGYIHLTNYFNDPTYSFVINKSLQGSYSLYNVNDNTEFSVTVELTYNDVAALNNISFNKKLTNDSVTGDTSTGYVRTVRLFVKKNSPISISNIPSGTQIRVNEYTTDSMMLDEDLSTISYSGTVTSNGSFTLVNNYTNSYRLKIRKKVDFQSGVSDVTEIDGLDGDTKFLVYVEVEVDDLDFFHDPDNPSATEDLINQINFNHTVFSYDLTPAGAGFYTWVSENEPVIVTNLDDSMDVSVLEYGPDHSSPYIMYENLDELVDCFVPASSVTSFPSVTFTNHYAECKLINRFYLMGGGSFEPYVLPSAGLEDGRIWMFGAAFVILLCALGYSYASYRMRKSD